MKKNKTTYSLKTLITDIFNKVYKDQIDIPVAVGQVMKLIENEKIW